MSLEPGSVIGPYRILETLGVGGMGEVYRARDTRLERDVALKVILPGKTADPERRKRFVQEARSASSLNHPGIVAIYDIGEANGMDYIAMELVRGATLDARIPRKGMRPAQALPVAIQIADALAAAHAAGIVHRDLKPGNVMIGEDGRVKLLDFGLAKLVAQGPLGDLEGAGTLSASAPRTAKGAIVGTVSYMAPEQAEGKAVDARSDIFSFGAILYEMITGERAFKSDTTLSTLSSILKEDPKRIGTIVNDVPPELERVISRCLRKDPERRWQGMRDIKVALEELKEESDSGVLMVPPVQAAPQQPAPPPKSAGGTSFLIGAVAVLVAVIGGAWWMLRPRTVTLRAKSGAPSDVSTPPEAPAPQSVPSAPSVPREVRLPDGTKVTLTLLEDLSSASAESGARIALKVAQDVKVGGVVVIPKGADASGTVADVEKKRFFRRTPKLQLRMSYVKASDGESVRLRAVASAAARGTAVDVLDLAVAGPSEDAKGKDIVVPGGTLLVAYVDEDKVFPPSR
jgi:serine/threonine protein kinase